MVENHFYFHGSYFRKREGKKIYEADVSLNLIAAYSSNDMVIGPKFKVGNPYDDAKKNPSLEPNDLNLPKIGTKGTLFIEAYKPKGK